MSESSVRRDSANDSTWMNSKFKHLDGNKEKITSEPKGTSMGTGANNPTPQSMPVIRKGIVIRQNEKGFTISVRYAHSAESARDKIRRLNERR